MPARLRLAAATAVPLAVAGCGGDAFSVAGEDLCRQRDQIVTCVDRAEYVQEQTINWELRSGRTDTVFLDPCATELARDRGQEAGFPEGYRPQINCGSDVTVAEIVQTMVPLVPGGTLTGQMTLGPVAPQGRYRMNLWILDASGERLSLGPYFSPIFAVFPSVN